MKTIHVEYVAMLREAAGRSSEMWTTDASDAAALFRQVSDRHHIQFPFDALRVAINDSITRWTAPLADGDRVLFLPPSSGG